MKMSCYGGDPQAKQKNMEEISSVNLCQYTAPFCCFTININRLGGIEGIKRCEGKEVMERMLIKSREHNISSAIAIREPKGLRYNPDMELRLFGL